MTSAQEIVADLRAQVETWAADDPEPHDRSELSDLLRRAEAGNAAAAAELADRFAARLQFGTAGLRGAVAAGPNRMNRAVVRAATAAVAQWLLRNRPGAAEAGVVICCDARHRSGEFANEAARVLAGAGLRVHLLAPRQPTPLLAFAVRWLSAAAGIMITASHNPPADNGYKLYLGDGAQIVPPTDAEIESGIQALGPLREVTLADLGDPLIVRRGDDVAEAYLHAVCALSPAPADIAPAALPRVVYTPLHGVACNLAVRAMRRAGYAEPHVVAAQAEPDPDFPTVTFPNPEHPGALDLAIAQARALEADLVLANDPDGDRLAVAVPDPQAAEAWRVLTGDQVGALLGAHILRRTAAAPDPAARLLVTTIVSSTLLSRIAATAGARYAETLTGFKWIVRAGERQRGSRFVFGYEEALGYVVGDVVRDKDGIGAALAVLSLAASARSAGASLLDRYDALEEAHGVHLTAQITVETAAAARVMAGLRSAPPTEFAGLPVLSATDVAATGGRAPGAPGAPGAPVTASDVSGGELPPADVLIYRLSGARVVIRPSGTEPKLKIYFEVVQQVTGGNLAAARVRARDRLSPLRQAAADLIARNSPA